MDVAQTVVGVEVEVLAKHEGPDQRIELVVARAGQRARLEPRVTLPRAALRDQVALERRVGNRERPALAVGPQPHVDAKHVAVCRDVVEGADDAPAEAFEELAVREHARTVGLAVVGVDEDEVDVRRDVELAAAQLAHADNDEVLRDAVLVARRRRGSRAARGHGVRGRAQCQSPRGGSCCRRLR